MAFTTNKQVQDYIANLATMAKVSVANWKVAEMFSTPSGKLIRSPEKINKIFFENLKIIADTKKVDAEPERTFLQIQDVEILDLDKIISELQRNKDFFTKKISELERKKSILAKKKNSQKKIETLKIVEKVNWFHSPVYEGKILWLLTPKVTMGNRNLGVFAVKIDTNKYFSVKVFPHSDNKGNGEDRRYHPFIYPYGSIGYRDVGSVCWGNSYITARRLSMERKLFDFLVLLRALLTTPNNDGIHNVSYITGKHNYQNYPNNIKHPLNRE